MNSTFVAQLIGAVQNAKHYLGSISSVQVDSRKERKIQKRIGKAMPTKFLSGSERDERNEELEVS